MIIFVRFCRVPVLGLMRVSFLSSCDGLGVLV